MKSLKKLAVFSALTALFLSIANKIIFFLALVKELLPTKDGSFYHWKFGDVFYTKEGSGSPLLLIHDLQADSCGYEWSRVKKELAKNHTVYTPDLPGCGRSHKPAFTYTSFLYVQFLEAFTKDVIQQPAAIAATGDSCSFVLLYASQHQDDVSKLFLINPQSFEKQAVFPGAKTKLYKKLVELPVFGTCIYNHGVSIRQISDKFRQNYFYDKRACAAKYINAYYEAAHIGSSSSRYLFASIAAGYTNMPVSHVMNRITMPVLLAGGEKEQDITRTLQCYCSLQPAMTQKMISGTKHLPQLEKPDQVIEMIQSFC